MSTPQSVINICSGVRLDNRYEHSIYFASVTAQREYFAGKVVKTFSAYSYLRKTWPLQVEATMEQAKNWSYLFFRNGTGKYYYYFINQIEYKNDNMVELTLELDVLQTYLFDFSLLNCFVERQHTTTDVPGEHNVDEGLDVGELVESCAENWSDLNDLCILVLSTINPNYAETEKPVDALGYMYDNVFSGLTVWAVDSSQWTQWSLKLEALTSAGFIDGIVAMWMYPKKCVALGGENTWDDDVLCKVVTNCANRHSSFVYSGNDGTLAGYTPKNRKLLSYPFRFLYATNNQGGGAVYRFERFSEPAEPAFQARGAISADALVKMRPYRYNGITDIKTTGFVGADCIGNYEHGLTLSGFPSCAWDADVYKLWLAQNQNQLNHSMNTAGLAVAGGAVATVASAFMGNIGGVVGGVGAMVGGAQQIGALLAQKADMAVQPPQARGAFSSNVNIVSKMHTFTFYTKSVDAEHARIIDDYFTMYGYKLNRVQKPNICARPAFTYVKTIGCNISGNMCTEDRTKITSIFDHGVTWWKNGDKIADYTQDNAV